MLQSCEAVSSEVKSDLKTPACDRYSGALRKGRGVTRWRAGGIQWHMNGRGLDVTQWSHLRLAVGASGAAGPLVSSYWEVGTPVGLPASMEGLRKWGRLSSMGGWQPVGSWLPWASWYAVGGGDSVLRMGGWHGDLEQLRVLGWLAPSRTPRVNDRPPLPCECTHVHMSSLRR